jgi:hypothetical protein
MDFFINDISIPVQHFDITPCVADQFTIEENSTA